MVPNRDDGAGVRHSRLDLQPVPHDRRVLEQPRDPAVGETSDLRRVETGERLAVSGPLVQDRRPRESGLRAFQYEHLEEPGVFVQGNAPFIIVVSDVGRLIERHPLAPRDQVTARSGCV